MKKYKIVQRLVNDKWEDIVMHETDDNYKFNTKYKMLSFESDLIFLICN